MAARVLLLVSSVVLLILALDAGLLRLGLDYPWPALAGDHGPLMVAAFFGALIALERAVGLAQAWTYLPPALMSIGGLLLAFGVGQLGTLFLLVGAALYVAVAAYIYRLQPADFTVAMGLGAALLFAGDLAWVLAGDRPWASLLWAAYLVLIVAGERLELSRFVPKPPAAGRRFAAAEVVTLAGVLLFPLAPRLMAAVAGAGFFALALWLLAYDVAWVNLKRQGVHKFMGISLLSGYVWLLVGGAMMVALGLPPAGPVYDAVLHSVLVGFVFTMVFGHAPVIFPAVLRLPLRFHPLAYLPLVLLHVSLVARLAGDFLPDHALRQAGGFWNALAIVLYFLITAVVSAGGAFSGRRGE